MHFKYLVSMPVAETVDTYYTVKGKYFLVYWFQLYIGHLKHYVNCLSSCTYKEHGNLTLHALHSSSLHSEYVFYIFKRHSANTILMQFALEEF